MTTASLKTRPRTPGVATWLQVLAIWHAILVLGSLGGVAYAWGGSGWALWLRLLLTALLGGTAVASALAAFDIRRRRHRGRTLSLAINYLGFLFTFFGSMHLLGMFAGIDSLADTFGRGLPMLGLGFVGYLVGAQADRFENDPRRQRQLRRAGNWIMIAAGVIFLFLAGLLSGLQTLLTRLGSPLHVGMVGGALLFGVMIWAMWRPPAAEAMDTNNARQETLEGYLFLSPNLLGFLFFFAGPLVLSLYVSFTDWDAFGTRNWVGLDNYAEIVNLDVARLEAADQLAKDVLDVGVYDELTRFTVFGRSYIVGAQDKLFWIALRNTLLFVVLAVPFSVLPALFLANLLNSKIPGMTFFRAIYFLPTVAAVVGIALVWQWLFNATVGYINYFVTTAVDGLNALGLDLIDPQIRWLSSANTALLAVIIMSAWQWLGYNAVLFLAGLQNIPGALYEAATVDGASPRQQFWQITVPLLAPTTFFVVTTTTINAMQIFEQVFILIPGQNPAGPGNSTLTMVLYLYQKGFQRFEQGYASAIAWVLFVIIFGVTVLQFQRQRSGGTSYDA